MVDVFRTFFVRIQESVVIRQNPEEEDGYIEQAGPSNRPRSRSRSRRSNTTVFGP
jgi:hypothetical protein